MTRIRLKYVNVFRDRHGKLRSYFRRPGCKPVPLPGLPGSTEFMATYQAALSNEPFPVQLGASSSVTGSVAALVAAYLDCSQGSTSPFKTLAAETQRTRRNILENFREAHGDKRVYRTDANARRVMLLTREHTQRIINEKAGTPFGQRNLLNTLRALFRWAVAEGRVPDDPTLPALPARESRAPVTARGLRAKSRNIDARIPLGPCHASLSSSYLTLQHAVGT